jgi:hypothetical protein
MNTFNNLFSHDANILSPQNMTLKGTAGVPKPANPKRSKTTLNFIDAPLLSKHIVFYKRIINKITYALISFSCSISYNITKYRLFFNIIGRFFNKVSKQASKTDIHNIKLKITNFNSYRTFIFEICNAFNKTLSVLIRPYASFNNEIKFLHYEALTSFYNTVFNLYLNLISKKI